MSKKPSIQREILIPTLLKVSGDTLCRVGEIIGEFGYSSIYIFYAEGIREMFGEKLESSLTESGFNIEGHRLGTSNRLEDIYSVAFEIPDAEVILGIGGGKVIDIAKYVGYLRRVPVVTFPTAPSNDSVCSPLCSVLIEGKRTTVSAKIPFGVISDTRVLANSPEKFIHSGIGDMVAKISSLHDWDYEERKIGIYTDDFAAMVAHKSIDSVLPYCSSDIRNSEFLKVLMESLIMSGVSMEIAGSSAPASGSEHLISHALDKILENPHLHGVQVGIATYIMVNVLDNPNKDVVFGVFEKTGFWDYLIKERGFNQNAWLLGVDNAPRIKPKRATPIHDEAVRKEVKEFIMKDAKLAQIWS